MMKTGWAAMVIAGALTLAGCSNGQASATQPTKTTTTASASTTTAPVPSPSTSTTTPAAPADTRLPIGHTWTSDDRAVTLTVQQVKSVIPVSPQSGPQLAGILVKACVTAAIGKEAAQFSWQPWSVVDADSQNFPATGTTYDSYPKPMFPNDTAVFKAGQCVKGWVYFDVNKGTRIAEVRYSSDGGQAAWKS